MSKSLSPTSSTSQPGRLKLATYRKTDVGLRRRNNEDSSYSDPEDLFFVVADGMGGHAAGEVASQMAVDEVRAELESKRNMLRIVGSDASSRRRAAMNTLLSDLGSHVNTAVRKRAAQDSSTHGMGTTLELVVILANAAWIGHVGDSRTYLVRHHKVSQLTTDHTIAQRLSSQQKQAIGGALEEWGSVLVEAIGAKEEVAVEVVHSPLQKGDQLLLCSDGLYEYFPRAEEIGEILAMEGSKVGLDRLVELALERGGKDNITGLLVEVLDGPTTSEVALTPVDPRQDTALPFQETLEAVQPLRDAAEQGYGIDEAIALMRRLPKEQQALVDRVLKKTLESTNIHLLPIIMDAREKNGRIERRVATLREEIAELEKEVTSCRGEIGDLETDRDETMMVKERLELAVKLGKPKS